VVGGTAGFSNVGGTKPADPEEPLGHALRSRAASLTLEPLVKGSLHGDGEALAGSLRKLPGERIRLVILDAERHGNLSGLTFFLARLTSFKFSDNFRSVRVDRRSTMPAAGAVWGMV
jgi:hypothetical protein